MVTCRNQQGRELFRYVFDKSTAIEVISDDPPTFKILYPQSMRSGVEIVVRPDLPKVQTVAAEESSVDNSECTQALQWALNQGFSQHETKELLSIVNALEVIICLLHNTQPLLIMIIKQSIS